MNERTCDKKSAFSIQDNAARQLLTKGEILLNVLMWNFPFSPSSEVSMFHPLEKCSKSTVGFAQTTLVDVNALVAIEATRTLWVLAARAAVAASMVAIVCYFDIVYDK